MPSRSIEPYRDPTFPERFLRWIESGIRRRLKTIPCYTESDGSPEGVIMGVKADRYYDLAADVLYVKTTDTGDTGWVQMTTGAPGAGIIAGTIEDQGIRWDVANDQWEPAPEFAINNQSLEKGTYIGKGLNKGAYEIVGTIANVADERGFFGFESSTLRMLVKNVTVSSDVAISARDSGSSDRVLAIFNPNSDTLIRGQVTGLRLAAGGTGLVRIQPGNIDRFTFNSSGQGRFLGNGTQAGIAVFIEGTGEFSSVATEMQLFALDSSPNQLHVTDDTGVRQLLDPSMSQFNNQVGNYTAVIGDKGKTIGFTGAVAAQTFTIPANASVAYVIGTFLAFDNNGSVPISIAITTDTLIFADDGTTGTRTLAAGGFAVAQKIAATTWKIAGRQLT